MTERIAISSILQFVEYAKANPSLLNIGNFNLLKPTLTMQKGCACKSKPGSDIGAYRPQFEAAMAMLTDNEKSIMKTVLNTKQICYYVKNTQGQLKQTCF
ncbi:hypothetical protein [Acinetobacter sp.]|uniref:hypothetical protein n=1 Tax=Acinetobacter sp. TaxID=472 RepID=UPI003752779A